MPGKSRRKRGKYSFQSKKRKHRPGRVTTLARQPAVSQTEEPVFFPSVPLPSAGAPTPTAKPTLVQYPYISTELRTIGILAGIMLTVLIVLALVLS